MTVPPVRPSRGRPECSRETQRLSLLCSVLLHVSVAAAALALTSRLEPPGGGAVAWAAPGSVGPLPAEARIREPEQNPVRMPKLQPPEIPELPPPDDPVPPDDELERAPEDRPRWTAAKVVPVLRDWGPVLAGYRRRAPAAPAATAPAQAAATVAAQSGAVSAPRPIRRAPPVYPAAAARAGHTGLVRLSLLVAVDGRVADVRVAVSSGVAVLDRAAADAARAWEFEPARRGGSPVAAWIEAPVRFRLQ